jgi:hypothetical protein
MIEYLFMYLIWQDSRSPHEMFFHGKYIRSLLFVSLATPLTRRVDLIRCFFSFSCRCGLAGTRGCWTPRRMRKRKKKDGKWSPTLFCAIMHGGGVFFLGFVIMPDMMCRHLIKGGPKQEDSQQPSIHSTPQFLMSIDQEGQKGREFAFNTKVTCMCVP